MVPAMGRMDQVPPGGSSEPMPVTTGTYRHWRQSQPSGSPHVYEPGPLQQLAITRGVYEQARAGIAMVMPASRPCVAAALTLYSEILDRVEDIDYEIFSQRATVGKPRRLAVAAGGITRAWGARLRHGSR